MGNENISPRIIVKNLRTYLQRVIFHEADDGLYDVLKEAQNHADAFEKGDDIVWMQTDPVKHGQYYGATVDNRGD